MSFLRENQLKSELNWKGTEEHGGRRRWCGPGRRRRASLPASWRLVRFIVIGLQPETMGQKNTDTAPDNGRSGPSHFPHLHGRPLIEYAYGHARDNQAPTVISTTGHLVHLDRHLHFHLLPTSPPIPSPFSSSSSFRKVSLSGRITRFFLS